MAFVVATWNVNSVRARLHAILPWLESVRPDVLCLQETKAQDHDFPEGAIAEVGYHAAFRGEKSYNGVAILSAHPIEDVRCGFTDGGPPDEARLIAATVNGVRILNTYVPQGRDVEHEMYAYKLAWFERVRALLERDHEPDQSLLWVGDLNVVPESIDVHDPKGLLGHVCFNPDVTAALENVMDWGLVDVFRQHVRDPGMYTYYDYRVKGGVSSGKGWRIDHILATQSLAARCTDSWIDLAPRSGEKPSDHTPLLASLDLSA